MDSKALNRWFFVMALLPLVALTFPFFIPVFMGVSLACVAMQLRDMGVGTLKLRRSWANVLVPTLLVCTFLVVMIFVILSLSSAVRYIRTDIKLDDVSGALARLKNSALLDRLRYSLSRIGVTNFSQMTNDFSQDMLANLTDPLKHVVSQLPALFVGLFIFVLSFLGIYLNESQVKGFILTQSMLPQRYARVLLHAFSEYSYSSYVAAGVTAIAQGALIGFGAALAGAPSSFVFGVVGALSSLLPYVGTFPVSIVIGLLLYAKDATSGQFITLLIFAILAGIVDNVLRPIIVKSRSDLHPWVAFLSIFGGLYFWGLAGVFIGPVLAGMSLDLSKEILKDS